MVVRSDQPTAWEEVDVSPITDLLVVPDHRIVVFVDFSDIVAFGETGVAWAVDELVRDDLEIVRADGDALHLAGFSGPLNRAEFTVDLWSGAASGLD